MVKYNKKISFDKLHIPKSIREEFGEDAEVEIIPNKNCFLVKKTDVSVEKTIQGLDIIKAQLEED